MVVRKFKEAIRSILPEFILASRRRFKRYSRSMRDRSLTPAQVFSDIYKNNLWGGKTGEFCSGEGSSLKTNEAYCTYVKDFIAHHQIKRVLDIGCGDFQVSCNIAEPHFEYVGIDVVEPLIERNQRTFGNQHITFKCLDVTVDELPDADLVLIREVLQHLSNQQISAILEKIKNVPYAIITEYQPAHDVLRTANLDKPHGMDTRIWDHSGVYLEHPPFSVSDVEIVREVPIKDYLVNSGERLITYLLKHKQE